MVLQGCHWVLQGCWALIRRQRQRPGGRCQSEQNPADTNGSAMLSSSLLAICGLQINVQVQADWTSQTWADLKTPIGFENVKTHLPVEGVADARQAVARHEESRRSRSLLTKR